MKEQDILAFMREQAYHPMTVAELEAAFGITDSDDFKELVKTLNQLEDSGRSSGRGPIVTACLKK